MCPVGAGIRHRVRSVFLCLKNMLQSCFFTHSVGAAPGLLGAQVAALLCPAESMGWEHGFPHPSWGREDACRELGSGMVGPETPCLPAKGSVERVLGCTGMARALVTAELVFGISASILSRRQQFGRHVGKPAGLCRR